MKFSGFQKTSLVDFPNRVASVLFTPGCNIRCPFCHNWRIVIDPKPPFLNEELALKVLNERRRFVDAVVMTGGEPTIHKDLPRFLKRLKDAHFAVKLDTNGLHSQMLEDCLQCVDYVALDVKTSLPRYKLLGVSNTSELRRSIEILKSGKVEYEFRTTVVPGFVDGENLNELGELVRGVKTLVLQQFVPGDTLDRDLAAIAPYSSDTISRFGEELRKYSEDLILKI